jgi:hypothetical protein
MRDHDAPRHAAMSRPSDHGDGAVAGHRSIPVGFTFNFYGVDYTNVAVQSNGALTFENSSLTQVNSCTLRTAAPNKVIAVWWDDLNPTRGGTVRSEVRGTAPNRQLIVLWNVHQWASAATETMMATAVLHETTNRIEVCYADTTVGSTTFNGGASATARIQNGISMLQYSCNLPALTEGLYLQYLPPAP